MDNIKDKNIDFFRRHIKQHKKGAKVFGWGSRKSQKERFRVLAQVGDLNSKSLLDIGCGAGDLYDYLSESGFKNYKYQGIDITPDMVSLAQKEHPKIASSFFVSDVSEVNKKYDYVIASGVFNVKVGNNFAFLTSQIQKMFEVAKIGVAFNLTSSLADPWFVKNDKEIYYYDPVKVISLCLKLSRFVVFRHEYMPHDFTIFIYKDHVK